MSPALTEDHLALAGVARAVLEGHGGIAMARALLEVEASELPKWWPELGGLGWLGLHVSEEHGGQGYGLAELAVVVAELGRVVAPGPFLPTVIASATIAEVGTPEQQTALLSGLVDGTLVATVAFGQPVDGAHIVLAGGLADTFLLPQGVDLAVFDRSALRISPRGGIDPSRPLASVELTGDPTAVLSGGVAVSTRIGRALAAAEASGGARACIEMSAEYAKVREQFGRVIGSFQAVKHHCAEMLVDAELAAAVAWNATRSGGSTDPATRVAAAVAASQALPAYERSAERTIQIHGGIGYTWEHDAHLHVRRAAALAAVFDAASASEDVSALVAGGAGVDRTFPLPPEAEQYRAEARAFRARHDALPAAERRAALIDSGYYVPHWPAPWGRSADAIEQLVIEEELADVEHADLGIGAWVLLTLVSHSTPDQAERWIRPSLDGKFRWCQLFSEPNAGSDAAAITTRATRVDGGWSVTGQKVWTSDAMASNMGLATVRTNPDLPKHKGITAVAIDMKAPGVEVRPLREITGETFFNEVFLDEVFVPDDDVVGEVDGGWTVARATLGNERVSIGASTGGVDVVAAEELVSLAAAHAPGDAGVARDVGRLVAESHAMANLNLRHVMRSVVGGPPGAEGNVAKLLSAEHAQRVAAASLHIAKLAGIAGADRRLVQNYLYTRCLTIGGGTSEIIRNVIGERLLGLPRDPLAR